MSAVNEIAVRGHERVQVFTHRETGAIAVIAVHDTTLGPGLGGCRMRKYPDADAAFHDALGLSQGMTYKNALANLSLGGGKSVLLADHAMTEGREDLFLWFGRCVETMGGSYITAEDMGTNVSDMEVVRRVTEHVSGRDPRQGGGGDPSPWTALGVFDSMRACLERRFDSGSFEGRTIAIQGVGHVGLFLASHVAKAGGSLVLCDPREGQLQTVCSELGATAVSLDAIYDTPCDIFSPCAVSEILNSETIPRLQCAVVAGAANTQLADEHAEQQLTERGILYAPDFAINSGGVILCADELEPGGYTESRVRERVSTIYHTTKRVFEEAEACGELPGQAAIRLAKERIEKARQA